MGQSAEALEEPTVAWNAAAERLETFALSRCRSLGGTGEHFSHAAAFDPQAFFKDALGISQAERPWKVRLVFLREVATYIGGVAPKPADAPPTRRRLATSPRDLQPQGIDAVDSLVGALCEGIGSARTAGAGARKIATGAD